MNDVKNKVKTVNISYICYRFPLDQFRIQCHMSHTGRARKAQRKRHAKKDVFIVVVGVRRKSV